MNSTPPDFDAKAELPEGFLEFFEALHERFTPRQQEMISARRARLARAHAGDLPEHHPNEQAAGDDWSVDLPIWCQDQRNQMTGPADDLELVVKMINSGAPGVMLDLEDSMANEWGALNRGIENILGALRGTLEYEDKKRGLVAQDPKRKAVVLNRVRGLHLHQAGILGPRSVTSASLFDLSMITYQVDHETLQHPLCFYIPKSESAEEALWWRDVFRALAAAKGWSSDAIKCMALVEAHPLAYEMEAFVYNLRDHILGLNLGRWDYMASLIHFNLADPHWVLPDRNTIPHDVPFFQRLRLHLADVCHRRGILAIGGMTALFPSRKDPELNQRALAALEQDKKNEADCCMDGAWTGHPDQNAIAVAQFPHPNQVHRRPETTDRTPDLRPRPEGVGAHTLEGTRAAIRTTIRYRNGVLNGKGASLLDGYMEDLATDRIYRLMIAQRMRHRDVCPIRDAYGATAEHSPQAISRLFDEELENLAQEQDNLGDIGNLSSLENARRVTEEMILESLFDPI